MTDLHIDFGAHLPGCIRAKPCAVCIIANTLKARLGDDRYKEFLDSLRKINKPDGSQTNLDLTVKETIWDALSIRAQNCLNNENVRTLRDLTGMTEAVLLRIPNFGRKALNEVRIALGKLGLKLAG